MSHVAFLIPGLDHLAGAERQVIDLATGLARTDWQVTVIALSGTGTACRNVLLSAGVDFVSLGMRKGLADPRGWLRLRTWLRAHRPDIVHAHLPHAAWMARWSRLIAPQRVVVDTVHTSDPGPATRRLAYRCTNALTDAVTFISHDAAEAWVACGAVTADRARVIPNAVDTSRFRPRPSQRIAARARYGVDDEFVWLAVGRLEPVKNYPLLLSAMACLASHAQLWIAGAGSQERDLRDRTAALGLEARVRFLGFVDRPEFVLQVADAVVLASHGEGLPLALLEAGACAIPAVATRVPGSRDVLLHGETGLLTPPGGAGALAAGMRLLMQMPAPDRARMGVLARQRIQAQFSLPRVLQQWQALYTELLARSAGLPRTDAGRQVAAG